MRPSLARRKWGEGGSVNSGEAMAMPTPSQKAGNGLGQGVETGTSQPMERAGQDTEIGLDSFLGILEYLSEATGLSIEDIADLLSSKEGPMGAMVLAGHLQSTIKPGPSDAVCVEKTSSRYYDQSSHQPGDPCPTGNRNGRYPV